MEGGWDGESERKGHVVRKQIEERGRLKDGGYFSAGQRQREKGVGCERCGLVGGYIKKR